MADYIERKAAFNMMFSRANPYGGQEKVNPAEIWNQAATIIRTMPAANVREDVQGKWAHLGGDEWCCTVCGNVIHTEGSWEKPIKKFCDECGTRMKL